VYLRLLFCENSAGFWPREKFFLFFVYKNFVIDGGVFLKGHKSHKKLAEQIFSFWKFQFPVIHEKAVTLYN
jgi:hypothetical protein